MMLPFVFERKLKGQRPQDVKIYYFLFTIGIEILRFAQNDSTVSRIKCGMTV